MKNKKINEEPTALANSQYRLKETSMKIAKNSIYDKDVGYDKDTPISDQMSDYPKVLWLDFKNKENVLTLRQELNVIKHHLDIVNRSMMNVYKFLETL